MTGLLFKDLLNLRKYSKTLAAVFLIWCAIYIPQGSVNFLAGMMCILTVMMAVGSMSYDESAKWDRYALAMPLTRRDLVLAKYLLALLLGVGGSLLALLIGFIASFFIPASIADLAMVTAVSLLLSLVYASIVLPFIYKLGVEKARLIMIVAFLVPYALVVGLGRVINVDLSALESASPTSLLLLGAALTALVVFISYRVSYGIFAKRDL